MNRVRLVAFALILGCGNVIAEDQTRTFTNKNIGVVEIIVPENWKSTQRQHMRFGTTFYRLQSPAKNFDLEFIINDLKHMRLNSLTNKGLEQYISNNLRAYVAQSLEKKVLAHRFGKNKDGVYGRLTDDSEAKDEFRYLSQGARLLSDQKTLVLFFLKSNDKNRKLLENVLAITESIKIK